MLRRRTGVPSTSREPAYSLLGMTPERIFIRVDLPAPFSPATACTSPLSKATVTLRRACAPPNHLSIPISFAAGGLMAAEGMSVHRARCHFIALVANHHGYFFASSSMFSLVTLKL